MKKKISEFKPGETVYWIEDGWNEVVATVFSQKDGWVTLCGTSLTFGCCEVDWVVRPLDMLVSKWQENVPEILQENI
jgi:hypothetical protein